jgi:anti-anti-sigma factor
MTFITTSHGAGRVPVTILHIHDRINMGNTKELEAAAQDAFAQGARYLLLDLAETPSITSAGLSALTQIYKLFEHGDAAGKAITRKPAHRSAHIKLCNVTPQVREVLGFVGLSDYIGIYDSVTDAMAAFQSE